MTKETYRPTRRQFLAGGCAAVAAPYVIPAVALGADGRPPASERIVMGGIGLRNQGGGDRINFLRNEEVQYAAACDVLKSVRDRFQSKNCKVYVDYRELLARPDIDAVHIGTPEHWHAQMIVDACRAGKDVFCQKPESLTLGEGPKMVAAARRYGRVVSGGSQRVLEDYRPTVDKCWAGELGTIKSININGGNLSQPCNLPAEPVPEGLDWDLWLGPAPWAPFNRERLGFNRWRDYSGGGLTDWGSHHFGAAMFAVGVRDLQPEEVIYHAEQGGHLTFRFAGGVLLTHKCPGKKHFEVEGTPGEKKAPQPVPVYAGRSKLIHGDFLDCVKTRRKPFRDIQYAANTMAVCHLAVIAYDLKRSLKWDAARQEFVGDEEANRFVDRARREPWWL
jgi:predicted dehydrogenase